MKKILATLVVSVFVSTGYGVDFASSQQVGTAKRIVNSVDGNRNNAIRQLSVSDAVFSSEEISAGAESHGSFQLSDRSKIIVGPSSTIFLDDFLVSGNTVSGGVINVTKGAFRFISGNSKKGAFSIKTPVSTIGIRGTTFDVYVEENGQTDVILYSGQVEVCATGGNCRTIRQSCDIVRVKNRRDIESREFLRSGDRKTEDGEYDLITRQFRFPLGWQAPTASCSFRATIEFDDSKRDSAQSPNPDISLPDGRTCPKC